MVTPAKTKVNDTKQDFSQTMKPQQNKPVAAASSNTSAQARMNKTSKDDVATMQISNKTTAKPVPAANSTHANRPSTASTKIQNPQLKQYVENKLD